MAEELFRVAGRDQNIPVLYDAVLDKARVPVALVDASGDPISVGGGTQYTEGQVPGVAFIGTAVAWDDAGTARVVDAGHPLPVTGGGGGTEVTGDSPAVVATLGPFVMGMRRDADTSPVSADNDNHPLVFDDEGNLKVHVKAGGTSGGATELKQDDGIALLTTIDADTSALAGVDYATQVTLAALLTELQGKADLAETQPVSATSLPLPLGAATAAAQATLLTELQGKADLAETQPVADSALLTELQAKADLTETQPVSASSLPLPTSASTSALQTTGNTSLSTIAGDTTSLDTKVTTCDTDDVDLTKVTPSYVSGTFDMTGLSGTYTDINAAFGAISTEIYELTVYNTSDADCIISGNDGTDVHMILPAGGFDKVEWRNKRMTGPSGGVQVKWSVGAAAANVGYLYAKAETA